MRGERLASGVTSAETPSLICHAEQAPHDRERSEWEQGRARGPQRARVSCVGVEPKHPLGRPLPCRVREFQPGMFVPTISRTLKKSPRLTIFTRRLTLCVSSEHFAFLLLNFLRMVIKETGHASACTPARPNHKSPSEKGDPWLTLILAAT